MEDVRPELEVEQSPSVAIKTDKTDTQLAAELYGRLSHDAGNLQLQIRDMQASLEEIFIKMTNARIDYLKAKKAETRAHIQEATPEGVTQ